MMTDPKDTWREVTLSDQKVLVASDNPMAYGTPPMFPVGDTKQKAVVMFRENDETVTPRVVDLYVADNRKFALTTDLRSAPAPRAA